MRRIAILVLLALSLSGFTPQKQTITVKGSDTMVILAQRWAETYMAKRSGIAIQVTGGGSGAGIAALINGTTDICSSSRPMKMNEIAKLKSKYNSSGVKIKAAKDGLSIYLNNSNPVKELTLEQIKNIYTGKITNWKEVGGGNAKIIIYGRENNSGTYEFLKDAVLHGADYSPFTQSLPGTASVVNAIAQDKNGIGYGGDAYVSGIKICAVKVDSGSKGCFPNKETIKSGAYPIARYLYFYTKTKPAGAVKEFIDWVLSDEGQSVVQKVGYYPVK
jgi:phosphate transport system substrate-binding protein